MKNSFFLILLVASVAFLSSCNKEEDFVSQIDAIENADNLVSINIADLPSASTTYVNDNYFETYIDEAYHASSKGYKIELGTDDKLYFDETGKPLGAKLCNGEKFEYGHGKPHGNKPENGEWGKPEGGCDADFIAAEELPSTITDYIAANYPDAEVKGAKLRKDEYWVGISKMLVLVFDADGNFLEETSIGHPKPECGGEKVEWNALPASIQDYVTSNYSIDDFKHAFTKNGYYIVGLYTNGEKTILKFDSDGSFITAIIINKD